MKGKGQALDEERGRVEVLENHGETMHQVEIKCAVLSHVLFTDKMITN